MSKKLLLLFAIAVFGVLFIGCGDDDPSDPEPQFTVYSQPVTLDGGEAGLQFFARPTTHDVSMVSVRITNPANSQLTYNLGNTLYVRDQNFALQDTDMGYCKFDHLGNILTGPWRFVFVGNKATGDHSSFEVSVTHTISGK